MALTRKLLASMGIEDEKADQIIEAHLDVVNEIKNERDKLKEQVEELDQVKAELSTAKSDAEYKAKYEELVEAEKQVRAEFDKYKADIAAKETREAKQKAYTELLRGAGVSDKRIESVLKVSGGAVDALEFDKDGKVKGADDVTAKIKSEWADFIVTEGTQGAVVPTPPENNGDNAGVKRSYAAQRAAQFMADHYGTPTKEV